MLGPGGDAFGYPTVLNVSQPGAVILGIANQESENVDYVVRVDLAGVRLVYNATSHVNTTIEINRTSLAWFNVTLADRQSWIQYYTFQINTNGFWKIHFLLFKDREVAPAYRELHLNVRVN